DQHETLLALQGRSADCLFSLAGRIKSKDPQSEQYIALLTRAKDTYAAIHKNKLCPPGFKAQALYKMAKCYEMLGRQDHNASDNLVKAERVLRECFFEHYEKWQKGENSNPYYFCRSGYDLARLQLHSETPDINSALKTYRILSHTKLPGTQNATQLADQLLEVLSKDNTYE
ncbi:MAG: hypothetical protein HRT88_23980, partial [Lentisphaeraceae bacterium]|nr:hypothetical protein [Lentisphaeraceae bacterium]